MGLTKMAITMSKDGFELILAELDTLMGGGMGLSFDEDEMCHLTVDNERPITFRRDVNRRCLVLLGQVAGKLPDPIERPLLNDMLALGLTPLRNNEPGLGLDLNSEKIVLHQSLPLDDLHAPQLIETLGAFLELQAVWIKRLSN
jgi:hypothetical protein